MQLSDEPAVWVSAARRFTARTYPFKNLNCALRGTWKGRSGSRAGQGNLEGMASCCGQVYAGNSIDWQCIIIYFGAQTFERTASNAAQINVCLSAVLQLDQVPPGSDLSCGQNRLRQAAIINAWNGRLLPKQHVQLLILSAVFIFREKRVECEELTGVPLVNEFNIIKYHSMCMMDQAIHGLPDKKI